MCSLIFPFNVLFSIFLHAVDFFFQERVYYSNLKCSVQINLPVNFYRQDCFLFVVVCDCHMLLLCCNSKLCYTEERYPASAAHRTKLSTSHGFLLEKRETRIYLHFFVTMVNHYQPLTINTANAYFHFSQITCKYFKYTYISKKKYSLIKCML